jgi:hypothetical protein
VRLVFADGYLWANFLWVVPDNPNLFSLGDVYLRLHLGLVLKVSCVFALLVTHT